MLTEYIAAGMRHAQFEELGTEGWFGRIPELPGVWVNAPTPDVARQELQGVLEDWLLLGLRLGHPLPILDGINLNAQNVA